MKREDLYNFDANVFQYHEETYVYTSIYSKPHLLISFEIALHISSFS